MDLYTFFLMFIFYSFIGYIYETIGVYIFTKKIVNRGFLIGPWCPIYGFGFVFLLILSKLKSNPYIFFFACTFTFSILEYFTSYLLEKLFKVRWWDYSKRKFNLNGRICLANIIFFGLIGTFITYVVHPFLIKMFSNITNSVSIFFLVIFILDIVISFSVISKLKIKKHKGKKDNTEEISKSVKNVIKKEL